jgi:DNA (cytosine-5)-methyltransferase 1
MERSDKLNKPPYRVPLMNEILAIPWNGYNVISTFSGAGGSCLGYRMAGYRVLWASEFIPAAQEVYKLNHPDSILDTRDIRAVQPQDILDTLGLNVGDIDILDGSPPCASFSTAGKREKGWGEVKTYSDTKQRVDDLFFEYARIVKGLQPRVFVAENVSGLVKGKAKGYFKLILQALKDCGYNVKAKLLDAQWLGVPQQRQRIIFMGVRNDLGLDPAYPKPLGYQYSVKDAIPWIRRVDMGGEFGEVNSVLSGSTPYQTIGASGPNSGNGLATKIEAETDISRYAIGEPVSGWQDAKSDVGRTINANEVSPSILTQGRGFNGVIIKTGQTEKRKFSIAELKRICAFPDDFQLIGTYAQQWERLGRAVPPVMMSYIAKTIQAEVLDKCK